MAATTVVVDSFLNNQTLLKSLKIKIKNHSLNKRRNSRPQKILQLIPNFPLQITTVVSRSSSGSEEDLLLLT